MKALVIDITKCNGCYNCQIACKDEHVANDWTPYAKPQPDTGHFWLKITEMVRGSVPKVRMSYIPTLCMHCDEAPCIPACTAKAIYKRDDGIIIIDPEKCTGSRNCLDACPYGVIYFNWDLNMAQKCTMCAHLLDRGWKEPRCVDACPTDALRFGEETTYSEMGAGLGYLILADSRFRCFNSLCSLVSEIPTCTHPLYNLVLTKLLYIVRGISQHLSKDFLAVLSQKRRGFKFSLHLRQLDRVTHCPELANMRMVYLHDHIAQRNLGAIECLVKCIDLAARHIGCVQYLHPFVCSFGQECLIHNIVKGMPVFKPLGGIGKARV